MFSPTTQEYPILGTLSEQDSPRFPGASFELRYGEDKVHGALLSIDNGRACECRKLRGIRAGDNRAVPTQLSSRKETW